MLSSDQIRQALGMPAAPPQAPKPQFGAMMAHIPPWYASMFQSAPVEAPAQQQVPVPAPPPPMVQPPAAQQTPQSYGTAPVGIDETRGEQQGMMRQALMKLLAQPTSGPSAAAPMAETRQEMADTRAPVPAAALPVPTAPAPRQRPTALQGGKTYTIRKGDTLSAIARRNGTTVAALAAKNGIADPNKIPAGKTLRL